GTSARSSRYAGGRRTGNARPLKPAITMRILGEILLVVGFRVVEFRRGRDLGGDPAAAGGRQRLLEGVARRRRLRQLRFGRGVDPRPVGRGDIVALSHALGGIVLLPEEA